MKTRWNLWAWAGGLAVAALFYVAPAGAAEHRLGGGVHYWQTVDDLADEGFDSIDDEGRSLVLSYQYVPAGLVKLQIDAEYFDEGFGGSTQEAISPQLYLLVGGRLYAGVGVGMTYSEDFEDSWSDPFYAARVGLDLVLLPRTHLDLNANYRSNAFSQLDEADTDTVTLGAVLRFRL
ncbi:MAG TPA: hypothetical protein VLT87_14350 [Thermoanaerobaculia bacterium]|nr:hypothetical protein [Thermoanaerobaculia bacterium]